MPPKQPNHACVLRPPGVARTGRTAQHRAAEPRACEPSAFLVWYAALHAVWPAAKRCAAAWMSLPQARTMSTTSRRTSCCVTLVCRALSTCRTMTAPRRGACDEKKALCWGVGGGMQRVASEPYPLCVRALIIWGGTDPLPSAPSTDLSLSCLLLPLHGLLAATAAIVLPECMSMRLTPPLVAGLRCGSMRRIACTARPAASRTRAKTSRGLCRRVVAAPPTLSCKF